MNQTIDDCCCCSAENTLVYVGTFLKDEAILLCEKCIIDIDTSVEKIKNTKKVSLRNFKWVEVED